MVKWGFEIIRNFLTRQAHGMVKKRNPADLHNYRTSAFRFFFIDCCQVVGGWYYCKADVR